MSTFYSIFLLEDVNQLEAEIEAYKCITLEKFIEYVRDYEKKSDFAKKNKVKISDNTIKSLFEILDIDGNGVIDKQELMMVFEGKELKNFGRNVNDDFNDFKKTISEGISFVTGSSTFIQIKKIFGY